MSALTRDQIAKIAGSSLSTAQYNLLMAQVDGAIANAQPTGALATIQAVIDRVLWTAGATSENRAMLAKAIAAALPQPAHESELHTFLLNHIKRQEVDGRSLEQLVLAHNDVWAMRQIMEGDAKALESNFYKAGAEAARSGIPLHYSALRKLRPGCPQYDEFIAGYDSVPTGGAA